LRRTIISLRCLAPRQAGEIWPTHGRAPYLNPDTELRSISDLPPQRSGAHNHFFHLKNRYGNAAANSIATSA
jgi:hypothetical protein